MSNRYNEALAETLAEQRNRALNQLADAKANNAVLAARIAALEAEIAKAKAAVPRAKGKRKQ